MIRNILASGVGGETAGERRRFGAASPVSRLGSSHVNLDSQDGVIVNLQRLVDGRGIIEYDESEASGISGHFVFVDGGGLDAPELREVFEQIGFGDGAVDSADENLPGVDARYVRAELNFSRGSLGIDYFAVDDVGQHLHRTVDAGLIGESHKAKSATVHDDAIDDATPLLVVAAEGIDGGVTTQRSDEQFRFRFDIGHCF